jgi:hypothetical protein
MNRTRLAVTIGAISLGLTGTIAIVDGVLSFFGAIIFVPLGVAQIIVAFLSLAGRRAAQLVGLVSAVATVLLAQGGLASSNPVTVGLAAGEFIGSVGAFLGLLVAMMSAGEAPRQSAGGAFVERGRPRLDATPSDSPRAADDRGSGH